MKLTYNGITCTDRFATIHLTCEQDSWMKFGAVRVPLEALLHPDITDAMDRVVRRKLIEVWSEVDVADPLF